MVSVQVSIRRSLSLHLVLSLPLSFFSVLIEDPKRGRPCHATWICRECRAKLCHDKPRHDHAHLIHSCLRSRPGFCGPDFLFCYGPFVLCPFGAMIEQELLRNWKEWRSPPRNLDCNDRTCYRSAWALSSLHRASSYFKQTRPC